ncbi:MAG: 50S ribosomal protein L10 [Chloroflexota bacterium]|nr:50S ribosomal protein L10 [Chloroflexota bacterium]
MAISKKKKEELVAQYNQWVLENNALILTHYKGISVNDLEELRRDTREIGAGFHIIKNTLMKIAFEEASLDFDDNQFTNDTAFGFAAENMPSLAKTIVEFAEDSDFIEFKVGYLNGERISAGKIKALAKVPPLPILRAQLLSTLLAPATKLVRTLSEPGRQIAGVLKAYSEQDAATETA